MIWRVVPLALVSVFAVSFLTLAYMLWAAEPAASCWSHCLNAKLFARVLMLAVGCAAGMGIYSACVDRWGYR